jgi:hypothetical protein
MKAIRRTNDSYSLHFWSHFLNFVWVQSNVVGTTSQSCLAACGERDEGSKELHRRAQPNESIRLKDARVSNGRFHVYLDLSSGLYGYRTTVACLTYGLEEVDWSRRGERSYDELTEPHTYLTRIYLVTTELYTRVYK